MLKKVLYAEAEPADLRAYGEQVLGLALAKTLNSAAIRAKIAEVGEPPAEIEFDDHVNPSPEGPARPQLPSGVPHGMKSLGGGGDPKVRLWIGEQDDEAGQRAVPVAVNGVLILLPRNVEFECGYRYYEALNNAMETTYREVGDTLVATTMHKYPFQVRAKPPQAEIDAWIAANSHFAA